MLRQQRNVGNPLAQGRKFDVDDVNAIEQVLAETSLGDQLRQVIVGGQNHARINAERLRAAHLLKLEVLQDAEQFDLHARAGGADFVEEHRAFIGQLEFARASRPWPR